MTSRTEFVTSDGLARLRPRALPAGTSWLCALPRDCSAIPRLRSAFRAYQLFTSPRYTPPMRKLVITLVGIELLSLGVCGYALAADTQLTDSLSWAREFNARQPEAVRLIARDCMTDGTNLTRDGALQLFACMRRKAEARGNA